MKILIRKAPLFWALLVLLGLSAPGTRASIPRNDPPDRFQAARRAIDEILKNTGASGVAVAVAKNGKIVWEEGFGTLGRQSDSPVTPETMFAVASVTKALTATGLMILVDRGLIDLDKPANTYLGAGKLIACAAGAPAATVRDLIYHRSGLPMHWNIFFADRPRRLPDMDESIARYGILTRPPGEAYCYSNFGYGVLGHIIARASRKPYADFMKQDVFEPLGMTRTLVLTEADRPENMAAKYDAARREIPVSFYDHPGASAVYSSVHDLVRFGMYHLGEESPGQKRVLKSATLSAMHRESESEFRENDLTIKYLLGSFAQIEYRGVQFHTVSGGMAGAVSRLDLVPSENIASAVLANSDNVNLWALQHEVLAAFLPSFRDKPYSPPAPEGAGAKKKFASPAGLLGRWAGGIRAGGKELPSALEFTGDKVVLEISGRKYTPMPIKTELGDVDFQDGVFSGLFWGRIDSPDLAGLPHVVHVSVKLDKNTLSGSASAVSSDPRQSFCLPYCFTLVRAAQ